MMHIYSLLRHQFLMTSSEIWQVREISLKYANLERIWIKTRDALLFFSESKQTEYKMMQ